MSPLRAVSNSSFSSFQIDDGLTANTRRPVPQLLLSDRHRHAGIERRRRATQAGLALTHDVPQQPQVIFGSGARG